ncbi:S8 family serine peptidase [Mycoplasmopsis canis]|uniref:S8 family serine peptidase n=1 Tax=Mycoplasmopsis canis TaxID=29555 RepID=UPI0003090EA1|nr:S8 family serine peptidase [Mycoplasmopsis canis]
MQNLLNKNQYDLYKELDDYAVKNDVKLIFSSGNYNENNDNLKEIFNHSKKGNYISEFSFDSILSWLNKFLGKVSSNTKTNTETNDTELYYKKEAKNIILLKKILKNHLIDKNLIINQNDFFNNDNRIWNIIEGSIKFQSTNSFPNLINIGAVDSLNYPTNFTSYSFINDDNSPLISSYGESLSDQYRNHIIYKVNKAKEKFLKNRSESSLDANEREKLDEVLAKVKEESIKETRASILLEFEKVNSSSDEKRNFEYLAKFSGTSMAAPLVTGMISLLQSELKRELSLNEVKSILSSSSTYSSQKASNSYYSQKHLNSKEEIWRRNHSKNKTGFGIPKYFRMKKIINNNLLTSLSNESLENWTSSNSIKSTQINIKKEFNNLSDTISLTVQKDFLEVMQEYKGNKIEEITRFISQHKKDKEEKRRSTKNKIINKEVEYNNTNNIDKLSSDIFSPGLTIDELEIAYNFKNDPINYYDLYSHVVLERVNKNDESTYNSTRMKSSNSKTSSVERNNFGNYKNVIKTKYNYELLLNQVIEIKEITRTKLQETKEYKEITKIKNINLKNKKIAEFQEKIEEYNNTLIDFYKEYIKKYWVLHSYLSINGE